MTKLVRNSIIIENYHSVSNLPDNVNIPLLLKIKVHTHPQDKVKYYRSIIVVNGKGVIIFLSGSTGQYKQHRVGYIYERARDILDDRPTNDQYNEFLQ